MANDWFAGRQGELALLEGQVGALGAGVGGVTLVEGEQGIGKSSLLRAGLAGAAGAGHRVLWGAADELGQQFPLSLITDCLAGTELGPVSVTEAAGFTGTWGVFGGDPVLGAVEGLLAAVDRLCAISPVVLVAEDLQWADEASVLVWHRLSRAVGQLPLLLAASCRPGTGREDLTRLRRSVAARGGPVLELGPLPETEMGDLVSRLVGGVPGPRLAGLFGRAGGNPLYARELADGLVREGRVQVGAGTADLAEHSALIRVPVSLAAAIAGRLALLPDDVVEVLRWAAVLGQEFSVTDLQTVTGRSADELIAVIDNAQAAGVVAEAGLRMAFRHGLIRQVLQEGMPGSLRAALHLQAARLLAEAGAAPERIAAQLATMQAAASAEPAPASARASASAQASASVQASSAHGGLVSEPASAWMLDWLTRAAPVLIYRAPHVAADLLHTAMEQLPDSDPRREELAVSLVTVSFLLVRDDEVERAGRQLLARVSDPDRAAQMAWLIAYSLMRTNRTPEAAAACGEALGRPGISDTLTARLRALHAVTLTFLGQPDRAASEAAAALASRSGDSLAAGYAHHALSGISFLLRDNAGLLAHLDRGLAAIGDDPQATDLRVMLLSNRASTLDDLDRQAEALQAGRQALMLAEQAGTPRLSTSRAALAFLYFEAGQWDDAVAELEAIIGLPGADFNALLARGLLAQIAVHRDDADTAAEHLRAVPDEAVSLLNTLPMAHPLLLARALAAELAGRVDEAVKTLAPCLEPDLARRMPWAFQLMPTLIRQALAAGDEAAAAGAAAAAEREAEQEQLPRKQAIADYCRGLRAGDPGPVLAAAAYYQATGRPLEEGQALEDAAVLMAAAGDLAAARQAFGAAVERYGGPAARWDIRRATARLSPYGVRRGRVGYRPRRSTGWDALTPTELKVAGLVANGRSNPDIAAELFLSRNTVQTHVSHILAKLGARSRADVIRQAAERPPSARRGEGG